MQERKVASTRNQTHNHQVMNRTHSPVSHPVRTNSDQCKITCRLLWFWKKSSVVAHGFLVMCKTPGLEDRIHASLGPLAFRGSVLGQDTS